MLKSINNDATNILNAISIYKSDFDLPYMHKFPCDCCEIVSYIFAKIIYDKYPASQILIVEARDIKDEIHFWVNVNDYVYDLTSHQFSSCSRPIIGATENPLSSQFSNIKIVTFLIAFKNYDLTQKSKFIDSINLLNTHIA